MVDANAQKKHYFLVCSPNSMAVEAEVNKILSEHPNTKTTLLQPISGIYCDRRPEMDCPKCASKVIQTGSTCTCTGCKRAYTQEEFEQNSKIVFSIKGSHYLQPIIIEE